MDTQNDTVPCKHCGLSTPMTGTKMCTNCWELERRIENNPALAARMLAAVDRSKDPLHVELKDLADYLEQLADKALPKFNWGASALDAEAIGLLNETTVRIVSARRTLEGK